MNQMAWGRGLLEEGTAGGETMIRGWDNRSGLEGPGGGRVPQHSQQQANTQYLQEPVHGETLDQQSLE